MKYLENIKYFSIFVIFMIGVYFALPSFTKKSDVFLSKEELRKGMCHDIKQNMEIFKAIDEKDNLKQFKNNLEKYNCN